MPTDERELDRAVRSETLPAPYAIRITERKGVVAATVYRRRLDTRGRDRLQRLAAFSALAYLASHTMLKAAAGTGRSKLQPGELYPLGEEWGVRVGCLAIVTAGLRDPTGVANAVRHFHTADPIEAAWWLGRLTRDYEKRVLRALRVLVDAVDNKGEEKAGTTNE